MSDAFWVLFIWYTVWSVLHIVKQEPARMVIVIVGWVLAVIAVFGLPGRG